jgi:dienelactone hydrolase
MVAMHAEEVGVPLDGGLHAGELCIPDAAAGIVIFAHGSGSSRHSSRNRFVAGTLQRAGLATLLFDLLTEREDRDYQNRFDLDLLCGRLIGATTWVADQPGCLGLRIGYFGASTGAAAALMAAAIGDQAVAAVVSRGGRPDLAAAYLSRVQAATLLIVGGRDTEVLTLNQRAYVLLQTTKAIEVVAGATHLFEEPGTLQQVAALASDWFVTHLAPTQ